jgi:transposase
LLIGTVGRGGYEARVRELLKRCDPIFVMTIEAMLDVRRAIFEGFDRSPSYFPAQNSVWLACG